jgi:hypothetical protein
VIERAAPPNILQIVREPIKPGREADYAIVEDEIARVCVELGCPHVHLAMEPVTGAKEIWWLGTFESAADVQRIGQAFAANGPLMEALTRHSARKQILTETAIDIYTTHRPDLTRGAPWSLKGARFVVVTITRDELDADGSVFDAPDGTRYVMAPVPTRDAADAAAARARDAGARVCAIRPKWGLPATEWIDADPEFWKPNPRARRLTLEAHDDGSSAR